MFVKIGYKEYLVTWKHVHPDDKDQLGIKPGTICELFEIIGSTKELLDWSKAKLYAKDDFCRKTGRRASFKILMKHLNQLTFTKEVRTIFWNEYHKIWKYGKR